MIRNDASLWKRARLSGAFAYHSKWLGKLTLLVLLVIVLSQALSLGMAAAGIGDYQFNRIESNIGVVTGMMLVCACLAAGKRTQFLLRFGTPRWSVWLSNVVCLVVGMLAFLLLTLGVSALLGYVVLALENAGVPGMLVRSYYANGLSGAALLTDSLQNAFKNLPGQLAYVAQWTCLCYLFGCCLRRHRAITLAVVLGVPAALFMLLLMPTVGEALSALESSAALSPAMFRFLLWVSDAVSFIDKQWPQIQLGLALASLPLSYLCMRGTPQPA